MRSDQMSKIWREYRERAVSREIHPDDHMFNSAVNGWDDYVAVGVSAAEVINYVLSAAPSGEVRRFMDFGCGHGRVARHLRAMFPFAEGAFVDIDSSCVEFCSDKFDGIPIASKEEFSELKLPGGLDLIWLGSVFTHLDYGRMNALFNLLASSLSRHGCLIGTFRGKAMYMRMKGDMERDESTERKWRSLIQQYEAAGVGYAPYNKAENADWGLSLSSIEAVVGLGRRRGDLNLIAYREAGWAGAHDVAAWARMTVD